MSLFSLEKLSTFFLIIVSIILLMSEGEANMPVIHWKPLVSFWGDGSNLSDFPFAKNCGGTMWFITDYRRRFIDLVLCFFCIRGGMLSGPEF